MSDERLVGMVQHVEQAPVFDRRIVAADQIDTSTLQNWKDIKPLILAGSYNARIDTSALQNWRDIKPRSLLGD